MLLTGNLFVTVDSGEDAVEFVLNEKVFKSDGRDANCLSSSFQTKLEKQEIVDDSLSSTEYILKSETCVHNNDIQVDEIEKDTVADIAIPVMTSSENVKLKESMNAKNHKKKAGVKRNGVNKSSITSSSIVSELSSVNGVFSTGNQ